MGVVAGIRIIEVECKHVSLEHDQARFGDPFFYCDDRTMAVTLRDCCKCQKAEEIKFYRPNDTVSDVEDLVCPAIID